MMARFLETLLYSLGLQEKKKKISGIFLGRDQDARTTLRWLRLDYVYLQKES
jgi:hypothetical protein